MADTEIAIRLFNTASKQKELLRPFDPQNVRMYVCGPTVYDRAHIGNARPAVVFDMLFRFLRHVYGPEGVTYARNITDIDDKIIDRARETGRAIEAVTEETTGWYLDDMAALGVLSPSHAPRATAFVQEMIDMIAVLIAKGHAYDAQGHVLFEVASFPSYGALAHRSVEDMIAGSRVEVAPYKRDPMDFVMWKPSSPDQPGWDSPWGRGRPGWHIECSAMAGSLLGETFDIHGGGIDLAFPHHENERAQSLCAHGTETMAQIWMHNGFLQVEGEKMSKSLGNFFTVRDLLDQGWPGEVIRFVLLSTHYRKPMDWTEKAAEEAMKTLRKWRALGAGIEPTPSAASAVADALGDDLNTPLAIASLHERAREGDVVGRRPTPAR
ncbi:MAG: cysteine--tRNA ligase, partial [Pseudomonadota bacterium]